MSPTVTGFISFIRTVMGINTTVLPDNAPVIAIAYAVAVDLVNIALTCVPSSSTTTPSIYALAVYNLAADNLVNYAPDQNGQTFFTDLRKSLNLSGFVGGVIQSTNDNGTGQSMVVPDAMKAFTMANLQQLKTPWGRQYMAFAQSYGTLWGMS